MVMTEHTYLREIRKSLKLDITVAMLVTCVQKGHPSLSIIKFDKILHQVLQLMGPEVNLACHYIWLPNTLPVLRQNPIRHNLRLLLISGTTLRIYHNC